MSAGLCVEGLSVEYVAKARRPEKQGRRQSALVDIGFTLSEGETLGVVGESGSGKTTLAHAILRMTPASSGRVLWDGVDLIGLDERDLRPYRRQMQLVFQDPYEAMNPRMTIGQIVSEPLRLAYAMGRRARLKQAAELLHQVGLDGTIRSRYPRQISGGQRQRVALARALATSPRLLVLDEPTSGLDVSLQARILNLLRDLQARQGLSYLFISHDLAAVSYVAHRTLVLFAGSLMEQGPTDALIRHPAHPYTAALLAAVPAYGAARAPRAAPAAPPRALDSALPACVYYPWCDQAQARCRSEPPPMVSLDGQRLVSCHYPLSDKT